MCVTCPAILNVSDTAHTKYELSFWTDSVADVRQEPENVLSEPSAPPENQSQLDTAVESILPSAPPFGLVARLEYECCICQDAKCLIIFLQCGHVCTCAVCAEKISTCPLCRSPISQRVQIHFPSAIENV
ncbi:unnamed protein product [Dicrocoelium dendriticum]|nr:unnamed protein product [Dicrocoelium dendriticum]